MNNAARQAQYQAEAAARLEQMRLQEYPRRNNGQPYVPGYRRRVHSGATFNNMQRAANNAARRAPLNRLAAAPTPGIKGWFRRTLGLEGGRSKRRKTRRGRK
jgi:hypothetical protein